MVLGGHQVHTPNPKYAQYEGHTTSYVVLACIVGAFGGLIFGYDIGISGTVGILYVYQLQSCQFQLEDMKKQET